MNATPTLPWASASLRIALAIFPIAAAALVSAHPRVSADYDPDRGHLVFTVEGPLGVDHQIWHSPDLSVGWMTESLPAGTVTPLHRRYPLSSHGRYFARLADPAIMAAVAPISVTVAMLNAAGACDAKARHRQNGCNDILFGAYGWDIDNSARLNLAQASARIQGGGPLAAAHGGLSHQYLMPFHMWPNILNLTAIHRADPGLFDLILQGILAYEAPAVAADTEMRLNDAMALGERVYLIRDFFTSVVTDCGQPLFEVHFAAFINLDGREAFEVQAHGREGDGLGILHDPAIAELDALLKAPAAAPPVGTYLEVWDLCLRGNTKAYKFHAVNVDLFCTPTATQACDPGIDPYYAIQRIDLFCDCGFVGGGGGWVDEPPDDVPCRIPWIPLGLKNGEPPPPEEPPTIVPPPIIPEEEGPITGSPPRRPAPPPVPPHDDLIDPWPFPDEWIDPEAGESPPDIGEAPDPEPGAPCPPEPDPDGGNSLAELIDGMIGELKGFIAFLRESLNGDIARRNQNFRRSWPDADADIAFDCPEIQALYEAYDALIADLQAAIAAKVAELREGYGALREMRDTLPYAVLFARGWGRTSAWSNLLEVGGPWSRVTGNCMVIIPTGSPVPPVSVSAESQRQFQRTLARELMAGATYTEAIREAAREAAEGDNLLELIFQQYGECLRDIHIQALRIFFREDELPPGVMDRIIAVMLEGEDALTDEERAALDEYSDLVALYRDQAAACREEIRALQKEIDQRRREFLGDIAPIFEDKRENIRRLEQRCWILEGFAGFLRGGWDAPDAGVRLRGGPEGFARFCEILMEMLGESMTDDIPCLREYLEGLLEANCTPAAH